MKLAYTMAPGRGDTDLILASLASDLAARGIRCCGTVQINTDRPDSGPCDMDVMVLPDGPILRISQNLGPAARGCRLDAAALETAVGYATARLTPQTQFLIVNKFGKHEAEGRGFRDLIAEALAKGIPVLVGLNTLNEPAFNDFAGGLATHVAPENQALLQWAQDALKMEVEAA